MIIDELLAKYDEKGTALTRKNKMFQVVEAWLLDTHINMEAMRRVKCEDPDGKEIYHVVHLTGGENYGDWIAYLLDLVQVINKARQANYRVWIIKIENDCLDDTHDIFIGVGEK